MNLYIQYAFWRVELDEVWHKHIQIELYQKIIETSTKGRFYVLHMYLHTLPTYQCRMRSIVHCFTRPFTWSQGSTAVLYEARKKEP